VSTFVSSSSSSFDKLSNILLVDINFSGLLPVLSEFLFLDAFNLFASSFCLILSASWIDNYSFLPILLLENL
jgi:hypothetical protein